jgi:uncharacterized protein (TIGR00369 family)
VPTARPTIQVPPNAELTLGMVCVDKATPGRTVWRMTADERFANPAGVMQGGCLAAFMDSSMGAAVVTSLRGRRISLANAEIKVSFLAPVVIGSVLTCDALVVSSGRRVAFAEATVQAESGRMVARASSTYLFSDRAS